MSKLPDRWEASGLTKLCEFHLKRDLDMDCGQLVSIISMAAVADNARAFGTL